MNVHCTESIDAMAEGMYWTQLTALLTNVLHVADPAEHSASAKQEMMVKILLGRLLWDRKDLQGRDSEAWSNVHAALAGSGSASSAFPPCSSALEGGPIAPL